MFKKCLPLSKRTKFFGNLNLILNFKISNYFYFSWTRVDILNLVWSTDRVSMKDFQPVDLSNLY